MIQYRYIQNYTKNYVVAQKNGNRPCQRPVLLEVVKRIHLL